MEITEKELTYYFNVLQFSYYQQKMNKNDKYFSFIKFCELIDSLIQKEKTISKNFKFMFSSSFLNCDYFGKDVLEEVDYYFFECSKHVKAKSIKLENGTENHDIKTYEELYNWIFSNKD